MNSDDKTIQERHVLLFNGSAPQLIALTADVYTVGRDPASDIMIEGDPISRQHAHLKQVTSEGSQTRYCLIDGNLRGKPSMNGVLVNEHRCDRHVLKNGDVIAFGGLVRAMYLTAQMGDADFEQFQDALLTDNNPAVGQFLDGEMAIAVQSYLSVLEPTSIMLGGPPKSAKDTLMLENMN